MRYLDTFLYNKLAVPLLAGGVCAAAPFNPKIRRGLQGRRHVWGDLSRYLSADSDERKPRFWVHAASTGEFLQSLPILEAIKTKWPKAMIACTYFSPSADRVVRSSQLVDCPSFLPIDSRKNMKRFFSLLDPDILLFSRYDVWPNMVWVARERSCPSVLVNATLNPDSFRMSRVGRGFYGRLYGDLELICAASDDDRESFRAVGVPAWKIETTGDTKYDETYSRVTGLSKEENPLAPHLAGKQAIIGGSTWPPDEGFLLPAYARIHRVLEDTMLVLVPHEPAPRRVNLLVEHASALGLRPQTWTSLKERDWRVDGDVLIIDEVGILAGLYGLARIAVVGGGFSRGVHNILEPASLGLPVVIGPNYGKSPEALALVREGGAIVVSNEGEMEKAILDLSQNPESRRSAGTIALEHVRKNLGATGRTLAVLRATFPALFPPLR